MCDEMSFVLELSGLDCDACGVDSMMLAGKGRWMDVGRKSGFQIRSGGVGGKRRSVRSESYWRRCGGMNAGLCFGSRSLTGN